MAQTVPEAKGKPASSLYTQTAPNTTMAPYALGIAGGSQPHNNMQPYLAINYIICLNGIFPPRS